MKLGVQVKLLWGLAVLLTALLAANVYRLFSADAVRGGMAMATILNGLAVLAIVYLALRTTRLWRSVER